MLRKILSVIGAIALVVLVYLMFSFGGMMSKVSSLHPDAIHYYMEMFEKVLETGNSAEAMVRKVKINDDISNDDGCLRLCRRYSRRRNYFLSCWVILRIVH